jgi:hypothetical protein
MEEIFGGLFMHGGLLREGGRIESKFTLLEFQESEGEGREKARTKEDCNTRLKGFKLDVRFSILSI